MKTPEQRLEWVKEWLHDNLGLNPKDITEDTKLDDEVAFYELDRLDLVLDIEGEFLVDITDEEEASLTTVKAVIDLLAAKLA